VKRAGLLGIRGLASKYIAGWIASFSSLFLHAWDAFEPAPFFHLPKKILPGNTPAVNEGAPSVLRQHRVERVDTILLIWLNEK
jgi:hypothetical protein